MREIIVNVAVCERKTAYAMYAHKELGKRAGLSDEELRLLEEAEEPATFSPADCAAC